MRDVMPSLLAWRAEGRRFAVALVIETWGSSPRPVGSAMAIRDDGLIVGSVSAGCVESVVIEAANKALETGLVAEAVFDRVTDEVAWSVGLSCGGKIRVWIDPRFADREPSDFDAMSEAVVRGEDVEVRIDLATGERRTGDFSFRIEAVPRLFIVGAGQLSVAVVRLAKAARFETIVIDPRQAFSRMDRFDVEPDILVTEWPHIALAEFTFGRNDFAAVVTHDPKIDEPALELLLKTEIPYIGALGSRKTQAQRRESLRERGFTDGELDRIRGPIGLNIGAKTPEEIAISILAEIIQVRRLGG